MANSGISTLVPLVTQALDVVSRELVGFIPSVNRNSSADRLAANQTLYSWQTPAIALQTVTPGASVPTASDRALANKSISITNFKMADFYFTGEEEKMLNSSGQNYGNVVTDTIEQCIRAIVNQMDSDLWTAGYVGASRAYGTAGTTPFDSTNKLAFTAQIKKILDDNGAPKDGRSLIIDTTAGAALRSLTQLTNVNEAGSAMTLRDGELLNVHGMMIKESAGVTTATAGTGASYLLNGALAVGDTTVTVDTGSGTILAGDVVTIGAHKYVAATALSAGSFTINKPGIRVAAADNLAITVNATSTRNLGFSRNAMLLATRLCAVPSSGDLARDRVVITDARSGIAIELAEYPQYRQVRYEVSAAWGVSVNKNEHLAVLLG